MTTLLPIFYIFLKSTHKLCGIIYCRKESKLFRFFLFVLNSMDSIENSYVLIKINSVLINTEKSNVCWFSNIVDNVQAKNNNLST